MNLYIGIVFLLVAFSVSSISAYFSILGLVALFAANPIPVILMGSVLEIAKIAAALWLHRFWDASPILLKSYLLSAVIVLMLITSLGIFGFLSKSHLDQTLPNEITKNELLKIDLEINQLQSKIDYEKSKLNDLNKLIDGYIKNDRITQSKKLLDEQKQERENINNNISKLQKDLLELNSTKILKENEMSGLEAKLGPLKYFTEMLGIEDKNAAVRVLILILIFVFDPIAIFLAIAGQWTVMYNGRTIIKSEGEMIEQRLDGTEIFVYNFKSAKYKKLKKEIENALLKEEDIQTKVLETIKKNQPNNLKNIDQDYDEK